MKGKAGKMERRKPAERAAEEDFGRSRRICVKAKLRKDRGIGRDPLKKRERYGGNCWKRRGNVTNESRNNPHSRSTASSSPCSLHPSPPHSVWELLMYSGVRMVAPPLMEFPIFSFLHRSRSFLLGFTRFLCRSRPFARSIPELLPAFVRDVTSD